MPPFMYRCPNTAERIQAFAAEEISETEHLTVVCTMCLQIHIVNPATGEVIGLEQDDD